MALTLNFPAHPETKPFVFSTLDGIRIATRFLTSGSIGASFSLQILVRKEALLPVQPGSLEDLGKHLSQLQGNEVHVNVTTPNVIGHDFKYMTFCRCEQFQEEENGKRQNLYLLSFQYLTTPLINTNKIANSTLVNLNYLLMAAGPGAAAPGPPAAVVPPRPLGEFNFNIAASVLQAASAAENGAPTVGAFAGVKPFFRAGLAVDRASGGGLMHLQTACDGSYSWLKAMLIQNCGQMNPPHPEQQLAVAGGELIVNLNGEPLTGAALTRYNTAAFFVEEVWGLLAKLPQLSLSQTRQLTPMAAAGGARNFPAVDDWLLPWIDRLDLHEPPALNSSIARGVERVVIAFDSGLRGADRLFT